MIPTQFSRALPESERAIRPGFEVRGPADPAAEVRVVLKLRPESEAAEAALRAGLTPPLEREPPCRRALSARFGAPRAHLAGVVRFAEARGLRTIGGSAAGRIAVLAGSVREASRAFGVDLRRFEDGSGGAYRGHLGPVFVPRGLLGAIAAVAGLDDRPMAEPGAPRDPPSPETGEPERARRLPRGVRSVGERTEAGWLEALTAALRRPRRPPSVLLLRGGYPESEGERLAWPPAVLGEIDRMLAEAALLGITVIAAAGGAAVSFPASSPHVLACGALGEPAAPGTAGGAPVSAYFHRPGWQASANLPPPACTEFAGRGIPDVAGERDPAAAAAAWAGTIAAVNERLGAISPGRTAGYLTPLLYCGIGSSSAFGGGRWDPCTGWGCANAVELARALTGGQ